LVGRRARQRLLMGSARAAQWGFGAPAAQWGFARNQLSVQRSLLVQERSLGVWPALLYCVTL
jgi:hypothetical protein